MTKRDGRRFNGENNRRKTHCPQGHPLSGDNLLNSKLKIGKRECKTCHLERSKRYKREHRAQINKRRAELKAEKRKAAKQAYLTAKARIRSEAGEA